MQELFFSQRGLYFRMNEFQSGRQTLIFVHGVSGSSGAFLPYEEKFKDKYNILSFDLRGHGMSDKSQKYGDYEIKNLAEDLYELVKYLDIKKFILVSHSFGAFIAFEYLVKYSENVSATIFLSPSYSVKNGILSKIIRLILWPVPILDLFPFTRKKGVHIDYSKYKNTHDWNIRRSIADVSNTFLRIYLYCLRQTYEVDYEDFLNQIKIPTLMVHGKKDTIFPVKNSITMSEKIPNSRLVVIDSDHIVVLNNFDEVCKAIEDFVYSLYIKNI
jgi:pimeloyl-ACP methyl ester carboxylesterase